MTSLLTSLLPYLVLSSQILIAFLFLTIILKRSIAREIIGFIGRNAILIAFLVSLSAVIGSLFYSEVLGFEPCVLCWWQRTLIYPTALILGVALFKKDKSVFMYVVPMVILSGIIALYQSYTSLGGTSILPCTAQGGACSRIYVKEFGYLTIPAMSLTISLALLLVAWINKIYRNENSNA